MISNWIIAINWIAGENCQFHTNEAHYYLNKPNSLAKSNLLLDSNHQIMTDLDLNGQPSGTHYQNEKGENEAFVWKFQSFVVFY